MTGLFLAVLDMSLTASYVVLVVLVIQLLLRKAPKILSYLLWVGVLFRLVCPFSFESSLSLIPPRPEIVPAAVLAGAPVDNSGSGLTETMVPVDQAAGAFWTSVDSYSGISPAGIPIEVWTGIWLLGIAVLLTTSVVTYLRLKQRLATATLVQDNIFETDRIQTPFVLGFVKPRIYLPLGIAETERVYILQHEQTHIRRLDHLIKPAAFFVLIMHWFNPLIWLAFVLMGRDMEMSCDESVIRTMGNEAKTGYSDSLLSISVRRSGFILGSPIAFGESDIKSRIRNILNYRQPALWVFVLTVAAVAVLLVLVTTNPREHDPVRRQFPDTRLRRCFKTGLPMWAITAKWSPWSTPCRCLRGLSVIRSPSRQILLPMGSQFVTGRKILPPSRPQMCAAVLLFIAMPSSCSV
jgi:bla regulator protein BlaR1